MFEQQQVVIKSGEGKNYFEATATIGHMIDSAELKVIMENLRQMQKDRMEWASGATK